MVLFVILIRLYDLYALVSLILETVVEIVVRLNEVMCEKLLEQCLVQNMSSIIVSCQ